MELATLATATAAAGFLAGGAGRLALAGWQRASHAWQQSQWQGRLRSDLQQQAMRARMAGQAHWQNAQQTSLQSNSTSWRVMEVAEVRDESDDVRSFYLQDPLNSGCLPEYLPGQFIIVRPALGGADLPARCYSLSDVSGQEWYRISVKRQSRAGSDRLSLSNWLHDHIRVGDCLLINGPQGDFYLEPAIQESAPIALLAAGVGVTPMLSILKSLLRHDASREVSLYFQAQDSDHWPFGELMHDWAEKYSGLKIASYFSRLTEEQLPEVISGSVHTGKFSPDLFRRELTQFLETHFYMCGPDAWMQSMEQELIALGVPRPQVHWESFATGGHATEPKAAVEPWSIEFLRSGITTPTSELSASVHHAAAEQGLNLPAACHSGVCGSCKLKLLKGSVTYAKRPTCSHRDDEVVACIAQAVGTVQVDA